jgi:thiol-disulfide isomerase/thioredoxin
MAVEADRREERIAEGNLDRDKLPRLITGVVVTALIAGSVWLLSGMPSPFASATPAPTPQKVAMIRTNLPDPPGQKSAGRVGAPAPNFEWQAPDGTSHRLSDSRGKVVVVNVWATWCRYCVPEMPALQRVATTERDVLFLEIDLQEDEDQVATFFDRLELRHLVPVIDVNGETVYRHYALAYPPTTYFIGPDGVIRHIEVGGPMSEDTIRKGIAAARAG